MTTAYATSPRVRDHPIATWIAACTAGELLGFGCAALWAFVAFRLFGQDPVSVAARAGVLALMLLAGVFEGGVLGLLQWLALRKLFPTLPARSWIGATVAVAALGWLAGMLPSTLATPEPSEAIEPPLLLVLAGAVMFGALAGAVFGFAQWLVLRRHARHAHRWIWANALGWALGLPWSFVAASMADVSKSVPLAVVIGTIAGALMGASVAVVTGRVLRGMASSRL